MQRPNADASAPIDRTVLNQAGGSVGLVLLLALLLLLAAAGLLLAGRAHAQPYILAFLATLATIGVFLLFALAAGILRIGRREPASPLPKSVVDSASDGILVTDAQGRVVYSNAAYRALIATAESDEVRPVERVFIGDPGVSESVYRLMQAARQGRRGQEEVRVGAHKGEEGRWLRICVRPLETGKRDGRMTVWSLADVTRELQRHENVFQELQHAIDYLDHAPAGFFAADAAGNIVYLNATLAGWLDYDLAQVGSGGLKLGDIVAGQGTALLTTIAVTPGDVKTGIFDIDLRTRSGRTLPVRLYHKVAFGADGTAGTSRTLVLNRAHDEGNDPQRAAEVRFMRFFQNTPMAIATVDRQGLIAESNAKFAHLFLSAFKREGSAYRSILSAVAARDRGALEAAIRRAAEGQGEIAPVEAALAGSDERFATFFVTAIEDEQDNEREAAIVYALETTQQRTLENQVNQQQKMETIGRLAGNVAHDFNNLLGAIIMATDFLLNAHRPTDPSFHDIMQIKQNANRAASLVRQLLAFSRKQTMRPQVIDLGEALSDLTVLLRRLIGENVTLDVPQVRDLWTVKADVGQFEQVIINLAVNARDAMPLGGKLTLRTSNVRAEDSIRLQGKGMPLGEYVLVEVEDTGTGIAPEIIDKIFDPFYTTKEIGKGTGLGLSTVYGIVKQTGGFIYVDSVVGNGATFRIFLPRYIPGADDIEPPSLPETTAPAIAGAISAADTVVRTAATDLTGQGTILLVEDEEGLRTLNARGLQSRGYTVIQASNGFEALEELERQGGQVDLVVSDVVMPEMDGPALMKELRKRNPGIKIIFVSGYAEDAFEKSLPDRKQFNFLAKPFTLKQLVTAVKDTMAG
ncbi:MAG TPA: response regulator [Xanthobacteraceae bacterium]|jgi:two-component system cell cycle sensor histidine kinase/response regulator CckA